MSDNEESYSVMQPWTKEDAQRWATAHPIEQIRTFSRPWTPSGRSIEDIPLPPGAIGYPEVLHEALLDEEVVEGLIRAGKPDE